LPTITASSRIWSIASTTWTTNASSEDIDTGTDLTQEEPPAGAEGAENGPHDQIQIARIQIAHLRGDPPFGILDALLEGVSRGRFGPIF
jgi:hypothetical protein